MSTYRANSTCAHSMPTRRPISAATFSAQWLARAQAWLRIASATRSTPAGTCPCPSSSTQGNRPDDPGNIVHRNALAVADRNRDQTVAVALCAQGVLHFAPHPRRAECVGRHQDHHRLGLLQRAGYLRRPICHREADRGRNHILPAPRSGAPSRLEPPAPNRHGNGSRRPSRTPTPGLSGFQKGEEDSAASRTRQPEQNSSVMGAANPVDRRPMVGFSGLAGATPRMLVPRGCVTLRWRVDQHREPRYVASQGHPLATAPHVIAVPSSGTKFRVSAK